MLCDSSLFKLNAHRQDCAPKRKEFVSCQCSSNRAGKYEFRTDLSSLQRKDAGEGTFSTAERSLSQAAILVFREKKDVDF